VPEAGNSEMGVSSVKERSLERVQVDLPATLQLAEGSPISATVTNISPQGCHLICREMLSIGSSLQVSLEGTGRIEAKVMWQLGAAAGLNFASELPKSTFIRLFVPGRKGKRKS
jgi:hypothetical protein